MAQFHTPACTNVGSPQREQRGAARRPRPADGPWTHLRGPRSPGHRRSSPHGARPALSTPASRSPPAPQRTGAPRGRDTSNHRPAGPGPAPRAATAQPGPAPLPALSRGRPRSTALPCPALPSSPPLSGRSLARGAARRPPRPALRSPARPRPRRAQSAASSHDGGSGAAAEPGRGGAGRPGSR